MKKIVKLNKKWNVWRLYKRFFLWKKKITFFTKLKWFFNYSQIVKKYLIKNYAFKTYKDLNKVYTNCLNKTINKFYLFVHNLELRLDFVLVRSYFIKNITRAQKLIHNNSIVVNNKIICNKKYNFCLQDIIFFINTMNKKYFINRKKNTKVRKKKKFRSKFLLKYKLKNFLEINYKILSIIYVKKFLQNELLKKKKIKIINYNLFKKYWNFN